MARAQFSTRIFSEDFESFARNHIQPATILGKPLGAVIQEDVMLPMIRMAVDDRKQTCNSCISSGGEVIGEAAFPLRGVGKPPDHIISGADPVESLVNILHETVGAVTTPISCDLAGTAFCAQGNKTRINLNS